MYMPNYPSSIIKTSDENEHVAVGSALGKANRPLVYGGGSRGIMGIVSGAVLKAGGQVTGVVPYAMVAAGGEGETDGKTTSSASTVILNESGREKVIITFLSKRPHF
jgi:predicted Rossmann-fold nucleotide-binding protein